MTWKRLISIDVGLMTVIGVVPAENIGASLPDMVLLQATARGGQP